MEYKGYTGVLEIDEEDNLLHGRVAGLRDLVTFEGRTVSEARRSFEESIDFYLKSCAEDGVEPDRPDSSNDQAVISVPQDLLPEIRRLLAAHEGK